jgi:periplasmic copper chaperone A
MAGWRGAAHERINPMRTPMRGKITAVALTAAALTVLVAGPAAAHVTVNPGTAPKGGFAELTFRVPNERDDASTTKVEVNFPTDSPIASASVRPLAGWTVDVARGKLPQPVQTDDGEITEGVTKITWSGGKIGPGQYENFSISAGPLPDNADQVVFKALQTYSSGEVVSWIEEAAPGAEEPEHPAPVLKLTAPAADEHGGGAAPEAGNGTGTTPAAATGGATQADVDSAKRLAVVGVAAGVIGLLAGVVALVGTGRRRGGPTGTG